MWKRGTAPFFGRVPLSRLWLYLLEFLIDTMMKKQGGLKVDSCIEFLLSNSGLILCVCFVVCLLSILLERNNWLTPIAGVSFILSVIFGFFTIWSLVSFSILLSTQSAIPLKVNNLSSTSADLTYLLDGVLKDDNYYGPIKVDANAQVSTVLIENRRNRIGDEKIVLKELVVPLSIIE